MPPPLLMTTTGLPSRLGDLVLQRARHDVGVSAGGKRDDHADRVRRIGLGEGASAPNIAPHNVAASAKIRTAETMAVPPGGASSGALDRIMLV